MTSLTIFYSSSLVLGVLRVEQLRPPPGEAHERVPLGRGARPAEEPARRLRLPRRRPRRRLQPLAEEVPPAQPRRVQRRGGASGPVLGGVLALRCTVESYVVM